MEKWRLLDTGVLSGAENMAMDDAILECRSMDLTPNTLRFLQFDPATVLVGFHQSIAQEVRVEYCKRHGVDYQPPGRSSNVGPGRPAARGPNERTGIRKPDGAGDRGVAGDWPGLLPAAGPGGRPGGR